MSFLRAGAVSQIRRWAAPGVLAVGVVSLLWYGALHLLSGRWVLAGVYAIAILVFAALMHRAFLSAFLPEGGGRGAFRTDEGAIAYFAPEGGWVTSLDNIAGLSLSEGTWIISQLEGPVLRAPADADGADALIDAFSQLPGLQLARITTAIARNGQGTVMIWERTETLKVPHTNV